MGKFKAGDRVKILAGHPYAGPCEVGTVLRDGGKREGRRAKYLVDVDGWQELSFKSRELEPLPAEVVAEATTWLPKVGDRVNWTRVRGEFDGSTVEAHDGIYDFKLRATNGNHTYVFAGELEPAPLTIEAGKFYRTRDGRKVLVSENSMGDKSTYPWVHDCGTGSFHALTGDGKSCIGTDEDDLVAEWVDEPAVAPATAGFKVGDRVLISGTKTTATVFTRNSEGMMSLQYDWGGDPGAEWWRDEELESAPAPATTLPLPGTTITFTATGKVSAINDNGHVQVTFPDLPPGKNSFALPAQYVA